MDFKNITTAQLLLILGLIIIVIPPILTSSAIWDAFDFSDKGQIGDTIGGITAPFVNSLGAILVFVAFKEQIRANNLLKDQQYFQHIQEQIHRLEDDFFDIPSLISEISNAKMESTQLLNNYDDKGVQVYYFMSKEPLNKLIYTATLFLQTHDLIEKMENKEFLERKLKTLYKIIYQDNYKNVSNILKPLQKLQSSSSNYVAETLLQIQELEEKFGD